MKRTFVLFATFLLVFQLVIPGFSGGLLLEAEGENKVLAVDSMTEIDNQIETVIKWTVNQTEIKGEYLESIQLEDEYTLSSGEDAQLVYKEDEEDILYDDEVIGSYTVSEDGTFSIVFSEDLGELSDSTISGEVTVVAHIIDNELGKDDTTTEKKPVEIESPNDEQASESTIDKAKTKKKTNQQESESKRTVSNEQLFSNDEQEDFKVQFSEIMDLNGNPYNDENPLKADSEFFIKLDWELLEGHKYQAGDIENIQLPEQIKIGKHITGGELKDEFGNLVATYEVNTDGVVQITFTDYVENNSDVTGWIEIRAQLDQDKVQEEDGKITISPIGEEGEQTIPIERPQKDKTVEKQGQPNKSYNADEIEWTVTLNKSAQTLKDVILEDLLPEGTEYKEGSLKVVKQAASINGTPIGDATEVTVKPSVEDGKLVVPLGDIEDVYTLTYTTTVIDMEKKDFKNKVVFKDKELDDIETDATVTINRGEPLNKGKEGGHAAYDPKKGIITWYVEFNYDQKSLNNVTLSDAWTPKGKVELVEDSVKFQEMTIDENGKAHPVGGAPVSPSEIGATLTKKEDGFDISGITTDKPYYIVYETKVKERVVDKEGFTVNNKVSFEDNERGDGHYIGQKVGLKSAGKVNYQDKTIEWTIRINSDERPMKDITITDTLGAGLTLIEDSIKMTIGGQSYTEFKTEAGNPFKLTDIPATDKEIIVTYETKFKADDMPGRKAENKATISWLPEEGSERIELDVSADKQLNRHTEDNSWKAGKYDPQTKEITWNIVVNYRENDIENLVIHDIPQQNQKLISGSVTVNEVAIEADGRFGTVTAVKPKISTDNNEVIIEIGKTNKAYLISYKTSLKDLTNIEKQYTNKATVKDGDETIKDIEGKVGIYGERKYGAKHGYQEGKQVHWKIDVNLAQEKIENLQLHDEISDNQEYLKDSIKVYEANLTLEGEGTKPEVSKVEATKGELVSADKYELDIKGNEFTIKWNETVNEAFIVEYSTLFFIETDEDVTNKYTITGENIPEDESSSSDESSVLAELSTAGAAQGGAGYLIIEKLDTSYGLEVKPIEGIEFELLDARTDKVLKTITTDEKGHADFGRLLFGEYKLKETNMPEGYVIPDEQKHIKINKKFDPEKDEPLNYLVEVENYMPNHDVELLKKDEDGRVLASADFTLFKENGEKVDEATTNDEGKIIFNNLEVGKYYLQETKAPKGYVLSDKKYEFEITERQKQPIEIEAINEHETVEIPVEKVWQTDGETGPVTVKLLPTEETLELNEANEWKGTFTDLRKYDGSGNEITYSVEELDVTGYVTEIEGSQEDGFTITNIDETSVSGEKIWLDDESSDRPKSINVALLADGIEIKTKQVNEETNWTYTFDHLPKFDQAGKVIEYTVEEVDVPTGYVSTIDNFDITNLRVAKTDIVGEKTWLDDESSDRPKSITIHLLANGEKIASQEVTAATDWKYEFTNLDVYDEIGKEINYEIKEKHVAGYESTVDGYDVINVRSGKTKIELTKTWKDDEGETAQRTDKVIVNLFQNGNYYDTYEITEADDWKLTIDELEAFDEKGKAYEYSVTEHDVPGYAATFDQTDVTNTRSEKKDIKVSKTWFDNNSSDRPREITFDLFRTPTKAGEAVGPKEKVDTFTISQENDWKLTIENIDTFNEVGLPYLYEVEEHEVAGYKSQVYGFDIVNIRTGETEVTGTKKWLDDEAKDRPESITVHLVRNGDIVDETIISEGTNWVYSFTQLDKYDQYGVPYDYTIEEVVPDGYEVSYEETQSGYDMTNLRVGDKDITITKTWEGDEEKNRPSLIEVELYRSTTDSEREKVATYEVTRVDDWLLTIEGLEAFDGKGQAYTYEIEEIPVEGYETTIDGFDITNTLIPEDPEKPEKPSMEEPEEPKNDENIEKKDEAEKGGLLPKTATQIFSLIVLGLGITLLGLALIAVRKRKKA